MSGFDTFGLLYDYEPSTPCDDQFLDIPFLDLLSGNDWNDTENVEINSSENSTTLDTPNNQGTMHSDILINEQSKCHKKGKEAIKMKTLKKVYLRGFNVESSIAFVRLYDNNIEDISFKLIKESIRPKSKAEEYINYTLLNISNKKHPLSKRDVLRSKDLFFFCLSSMPKNHQAEVIEILKRNKLKEITTKESL